MKTLIVFFLTFICFFHDFKNANASPDQRGTQPNIVFIFADDLGFGDLGSYGHPYARTPAIDKLAKEGTAFAHFYVSGITCSPSRTGFMTGIYPARYRKLPIENGFSDRVTITELLQKNGYRTGHFGKWHIGPESISGTYGIDEIKVIGAAREDPRGRDAVVFDSALKFIEENKNSPFYVNIWGHISHAPVDAPNALANEFKDVKVNPKDFSIYMQAYLAEHEMQFGDVNPRMREYLGEVLSLDRQVQRVLDKIDKLNLRNDTIVVFSSDQGAYGTKESKPRSLKKLEAIVTKKQKRDANYNNLIRSNLLGYNGLFRGGKHDQYEGGVRAPFIIRWPGHIPSGKENVSEVITAVDWLPTLCNIAGIKYDPETFDGEDVSDIWQGAKRNRSRPLFWRKGRKGSLSSMRFGLWKYHEVRGQKTGELYNLQEDPGESHNVAQDHPEVVSELSAMLDKWVASLPVENRGKGQGTKR